MAVKVTFTFDPEPDEVDSDHPTGLTDEAHEKLMDSIMQIGGSDVEAEAQ